MYFWISLVGFTAIWKMYLLQDIPQLGEYFPQSYVLIGLIKFQDLKLDWQGPNPVY